MSRFRQGVLAGFIVLSALNLWLLLGAQAGYKYYGIVQQLDPASAQTFALRVEALLALVTSFMWWTARRR